MRLYKIKLGVWHSLVVRLVRDQEVVGSNPVTPTKNPLIPFGIGGFFIFLRMFRNGIRTHDLFFEANQGEGPGDGADHRLWRMKEGGGEEK